MKHIYKYSLYVTQHQVVYMPRSAVIRAVQVQNGQLFMWAEVSPFESNVSRRILVAATGSDAPAAIYLATVQMGNFVWHVYDGGEA